MNRRKRVMAIAIATLSTTTSITLAPPTTLAQSQPPSRPVTPNTQIVDTLKQLSQIPLKNYPTVILTPELQRQFAVAGTPLPGGARIGQEIRPEDIFRIGNFEPFGLGDASLEQLAQLTGKSLERLRLAPFSQFLEQVTLEKLLKPDVLPQLSEKSIAQVPALAALLDNAEQLGLSSLSSISPNTKVGQLVQAVPAIQRINFAQIPPQRLEQIGIADAIPGLTGVALGKIDGVEALPLRSLAALDISSLSLGQMPKPMRLVSNVQFGVADVALGEPGSGEREQQRLRVISGGIPTQDKQFTGVRCSSNSCPHFEFALPGGGAENGAAWMDGKTPVPDGFGPLCKPFGCKGPAGNHPFGSGVRIQLREIDQARGTAQVSLSFAYCRHIPFVGKSCTPWIFPIPSGIPIGTIREQTLLPFAPPQRFE